jgi:hypothetical protein
MGELDAQDLATRLPADHRVIRELAQSQLWVAILAEHRQSGRRAVVVELATELVANPDDRARVRQRADAAAALGHPHILPLRALDPAAAGEPFHHLLAPIADAVDLVGLVPGREPAAAFLPRLAQIADALDAAHRAGIVHGDVRAENVLIDARSGRAHLSGFGLCPHPGWARHPAPEVLQGGPTTSASDVYSFGALLLHCLTGQAPHLGLRVAGFDPPRPRLSPGLDEVLDRALAADPAQRQPTCRAVVDAAAAAAGVPGGPPSPRIPNRRRRRWVIGSALAAVVLVVAGVLVVPRVVASLSPTSDDLGRVPAAVRADCALAGPEGLPPGSARQLRCHDGNQQELLAGLYDTGDAAEAGYRAAVAATPGLRTGSGDCADGPGFEHLYPPVGAPAGRVLCQRDGTTARMVWLDRAARTVSVATRSDGDTLALYRSWAGWVQIPSFPAPPERDLLGQLYEKDCRRSPAGSLEGLDGVVAAVNCAPVGAGATSIRYLRFSDAEHLRRAYQAAVDRGGSRTGVDCLDPAEPTFLGDSTWDVRSAPGGRLACRPDDGGAPSLTWTADALSMMGIATGTDRAALVDWWGGYSSPQIGPLVTAINQQASPPFPTAAESAVLNHVPPSSRLYCVRPTTDQVSKNVGSAQAVAVGCATANGPALTFYYQYADKNALVAAVGPGGGPDCLSNPPGFLGSAHYTRPDGASGVLNCGINTAGRSYLDWSDERTGIRVAAFSTDAAQLLSWWQFDAGPS